MGIAIKPDTAVEVLLPYLADLDLILVMSVEPGFGGQKFNPIALDKIKKLASLKQDNNYKYLIEVDGESMRQLLSYVAKLVLMCLLQEVISLIVMIIPKQLSR